MTTLISNLHTIVHNVFWKAKNNQYTLKLTMIKYQCIKWTRHTKGTNNASDSLDTYMFQKKQKKNKQTNKTE